MWKKLAFAATLALCATPALASDWFYVGKNSYGSTYEIDRETLIRDGNSVTFWLRVKYGPGSPQGEADGYTARRRADCTDRSYQDLQTEYMKNGDIQRTSDAEEKRFAPPGSIAETVLKSACGQ